VVTGDPETEIEQIEYDSRLIKRPALFVAIQGFKRDGYDFVDQAKAVGAIAVMGERESCSQVAHHVQVPNARKALADAAAKFYGFPGERIKACGVTGTNGKTTTCFLIKHILEARNKTTGLVTSYVYDTGKQTFAAERTTPESLDMQRLLYLMKSNYCVNAVIEVSSHALVLHRVDHIDFKVAVYTNITRDHLDFHRDMDDYLAAKMLLAKHLDGPLSYAVINLDVDEFRPIFGVLKSSFMTYSLQNPKADVYCDAYELRTDGTTFDLVTPMGRRTVSFRLPGRFNLKNALAAAAGGLACGVDVDNVVRGLEVAESVPGRLHPIIKGQPFAVYVDFAHTPDAVIRLCETARELTKGRLLMLFGCGGDRDKGKRPIMGAAATENADYVVVTSDNPRSEKPEAIIEDIKPGLTGANYEIVVDRRDAIATILRMAKAGDTVLLAGKGAENYQEINGVKHPFDEFAEVGRVLAELGYAPAGESEER
jgi:UDP-N-acetylmuramoyl-L-alanyl-D-glutamate--2,6-diaminopimelate ligase